MGRRGRRRTIMDGWGGLWRWVEGGGEVVLRLI